MRVGSPECGERNRFIILIFRQQLDFWLVLFG